MLPPLVGVAVKVTLVPEQMVLSASFEAILTLTARFGLTVIVAEVLFAALHEPLVTTAL